MLRTDTSSVLERIVSIAESVAEMKFSTCGTTIAGMTRKEGSEPPMSEHAGLVTARVVRFMEIGDGGYFVIRP